VGLPPVRGTQVPLTTINKGKASGMIELIPFIVLSFAAYRITRFIVFDTLIDEPRNWLYRKLSTRGEPKDRGRYFKEKLMDLTSCTFCTGFWVSLIVYSVYQSEWFWDFGRLEWLSFIGIAGLQALLHSWELDD
jgi:hypothetical protein